MKKQTHAQHNKESFYDFIPLSLRLSYKAPHSLTSLDESAAQLRTQIQKYRHETIIAPHLLPLEFQLTHIIKTARRAS